MRIFKSEVHYSGYLSGTNSVQPLLEKVAAIDALEPPRNIGELQHFLGLVGFYRKFIPFFANVTACLNTMLRKGAVFKWTGQCNNAFNLLKSDLVKIPRLQYPNPNKPLNYLPMHLPIVIQVFCIRQRYPTNQMQCLILFL